MPQLSAATIKTIVELVQPLCDTENERRALIDWIFAGASSSPDIDTSGAPLEFTRRLVFRLIDYGEIASGSTALWALLEAIRPQVGVDKQRQIDDLRPAIFSAAVPAADYIVATEGGKLIFISYSTVDAAFADRLRADLSAAGLNLWIDRVGLKVGIPNWEDTIRDVLKRADGVLLIASPASRKSKYVRDELAIADDSGKPIYPVWANGETWTDSIPLGRGYTQYLDLRGEKYETGLKNLITVLQGDQLLDSLSKFEAHTPVLDPIDDPKPVRQGADQRIEVRDITGGQVAITNIGSQTIGSPEKPRTWTLPVVLALALILLVAIATVIALLPTPQRESILYSAGLVSASNTPTQTLTPTKTPTATLTSSPTPSPTMTPTSPPLHLNGCLPAVLVSLWQASDIKAQVEPLNVHHLLTI